MKISSKKLRKKKLSKKIWTENSLEAANSSAVVCGKVLTLPNCPLEWQMIESKVNARCLERVRFDLYSVALGLLS